MGKVMFNYRTCLTYSCVYRSNQRVYLRQKRGLPVGELKGKNKSKKTKRGEFDTFSGVGLRDSSLILS